MQLEKRTKAPCQARGLTHLKEWRGTKYARIENSINPRSRGQACQAMVDKIEDAVGRCRIKVTYVLTGAKQEGGNSGNWWKPA